MTDIFEPDVVAHGEADIMARPHGGDETRPAEPGRGLQSVPVTAEGQAFSGGLQGSYFTMVVSTGTNPVDQLLPRDYDRVEAYVYAADEPVVLAQSREMAGNPANQASNVPVPVGYYLPTGAGVTVRNCDELWVAATSATAGRVSVAVSRRAPAPAPNTG